MIRIVLVDDHAVVRMGLRMLLEGEAGIEIVGEADRARKAIDLVKELRPDVILMDIGLPDMSGIEATRIIKDLAPEIAVVALTIHEDEAYFFKMLQAGAIGYVPKKAAPEELLRAITAAAANEVYIYPSLAKLLVSGYLQAGKAEQQEGSIPTLTDRENEVFELLAAGLSNQEIGLELVISPKTVARHRENIMRKLNLHSRVELVRYAIRKGIISP